jgi:SM-20-related protein
VLEPTYKTQVDDRDIWVFDDLVDDSEIRRLVDIFRVSPFKKQEVAREDTEQFKHWVTEIPLSEISSFGIYSRTREAVARMRETEYKINRAYCNFTAYGDMLFSHTDCPEEVPGLTALWYICKEWDLEWGGETLFFNSNRDCRFACTPRAGRLVVFDGAILHVGRPPNRICYESRYTVAFKLMPPQYRVRR